MKKFSLTSLVLIALFVISLGFIIYAFISFEPHESKDLLEYVKGESSLDLAYVITALNSIFTWVYILFGLAALTTLGIAVMNIVRHPKEAMMSIAGVVGLVVIAIVSWFIGSGDFPEDRLLFKNLLMDEKNPWSVEEIQFTCQLTDMYLYSTYVLLGIAFVAIVFSSVYKNIK